MEGGDNARFPVIVAVAHRAAQRLAFDQDAGFGRVLDLFARQGRDGKTAQRGGRHQPLRLQPHQRFAERGEAEAVALLQRFEPQRLARPKCTDDDVGAKPLIGYFAQRGVLTGCLATRPALACRGCRIPRLAG